MEELRRKGVKSTKINKCESSKMPWKEKMCDSHNPKSKELSYIGWDTWASKQRKKQRQRPECGFWLFPEEV